MAHPSREDCARENERRKVGQVGEKINQNFIAFCFTLNMFKCNAELEYKETRF